MTAKCKHAAAVILRHIHLWTTEMTVADFVAGTGAHHVRITGALTELERIGAVVSRIAPGGDGRLYRPSFLKIEGDPFQDLLSKKIDFRQLDARAAVSVHRM